MILITGGAGFIGSNFILDWFKVTEEPIVNVDKLTYAGNLQNLISIKNNKYYLFVHGDVCDQSLVEGLLNQYQPRAIIHFAAETHVDRSILGAEEFIRTNIQGTFTLLDACKQYLQKLSNDEKQAFRFLHISTDEVYGSLEDDAPPFNESSSYAPNSPYAASKAAADHLTRSYHSTHNLPTINVHSSNNYGPYQFPEKLIPLMIVNALEDKPLPLYGNGLHIRDWLYVNDYCAGIRAVLQHGKVGDVYNFGSGIQFTNKSVVNLLCNELDKIAPRQDGKSYEENILHIKDRPGHDKRYALDISKVKKELQWHPVESFQTGLQKTIAWYLDNQPWINDVKTGEYSKWIDINYNNRSSI